MTTPEMRNDAELGCVEDWRAPGELFLDNRVHNLEHFRLDFLETVLAIGGVVLVHWPCAAIGLSREVQTFAQALVAGWIFRIGGPFEVMVEPCGVSSSQLL